VAGRAESIAGWYLEPLRDVNLVQTTVGLIQKRQNSRYFAPKTTFQPQAKLINIESYNFRVEPGE
jgi:hypothetical protein